MEIQKITWPELPDKLVHVVLVTVDHLVQPVNLAEMVLMELTDRSENRDHQDLLLPPLLACLVQ